MPTPERSEWLGVETVSDRPAWLEEHEANERENYAKLARRLSRIGRRQEQLVKVIGEPPNILSGFKGSGMSMLLHELATRELATKQRKTYIKKVASIGGSIIAACSAAVAIWAVFR